MWTISLTEFYQNKNTLHLLDILKGVKWDVKKTNWRKQGDMNHEPKELKWETGDVAKSQLRFVSG